jgi:hypothetical protein
MRDPEILDAPDTQIKARIDVRIRICGEKFSRSRVAAG